jgi:tRNA(Phe) wybutosine-synthesizing methylase Tyw3
MNPLNAELNPIWHLLALLRAHPILHIKRKRVKEALTLRRALLSQGFEISFS